MKVPLAGSHQPIQQPSPDTQNPFANIPPPVSQPAQPAPSTPPPPPPPTPKASSPSLGKFLPVIGGAVFIIILLFIGFRLVNSFLGKSPTGSGNVTLTYWGLWEDESIMNSVIQDFERSNPNITIQYQKQPITQYRETLANRIDQGKGPDIFRFHNTWVPMLKTELAPIPTDTYSTTEFEKTFYPVMQADLKSGSSYVGIPLSIDTLGLFINQDIFRSAGETEPTDWNDLVKKARSLTVIDPDTQRIQTAGVALGTANNVDHASDILALMMMQNGVDFKDLSKKSKDGRNLAEDVLTFYTQFALGDKRSWDATLDPSTLAFAKGKVAMYFGYSWDIFQIQSLNPQLHFKVIPPPQIPGNKVTFASYWVEGVSNKSPHQKEAFLFLKYLSSPQVLQKLFAEQAKVRSFGEPYSRVDLSSQAKSNTTIAPFLELAPNAKSWYLASDTFDNGINDAMIKYFSDGITAITQNSVSPQTALTTIQSGVTQKLSQYGLQ